MSKYVFLLDPMPPNLHNSRVCSQTPPLDPYVLANLETSGLLEKPRAWRYGMS